MDLKHYFQKIRETEASMVDAFPVIVSVETADGGKPGLFTEVPRRVAAKMLVDGFARLANPEEAKRFRDQLAEAKRVADQEAAAGKIQLSVVPTSDLNRLRNAARSPKE
jgi:hypothetical protein